jgi:uncharacterized protein
MFLDTSGLLSLYDSRDAFHRDAVREFRQADRLMTHNYVLAELVALVTARNLPRQAAFGYVADLLDHPLLEILWVDEAFHRAGMTLLNQRTDKNYTLCDAISFLQMQARGVVAALTTDHHFEQEGLVRLLRE